MVPKFIIINVPASIIGDPMFEDSTYAMKHDSTDESKIRYRESNIKLIVNFAFAEKIFIQLL